MQWYQWQQQELLINCYLQPKASKDEFAGLYDSCLKIRITAPPVDGKANTHLKKFLAKQFNVAARDVTIIKGELGKRKRIKIASPAKIPEELNILFA